MSLDEDGGTRPTVILVHGAWSDGSCWSEVAARLQVDGLNVVAVQAPLTSLADDAACVRRAVARAASPVLLVGHGWGGAVITEVGTLPAVVGLGYVAGLAPDRGESTGAPSCGYDFGSYGGLLEMDSDGFIGFPQRTMPHYFAQDLPSVQARLLAATQGPIHFRAFEDELSAAAWREKPTWYLVTQADRMVNPDVQRACARRMDARCTEIESGHAVFLSRPKETASFIRDVLASPQLLPCR